MLLFFIFSKIVFSNLISSLIIPLIIKYLFHKIKYPGMKAEVHMIVL